MISRRTTALIAELLALKFRLYHGRSDFRSSYYTTDTTRVYDFLFENGYPAWFCNAARAIHSYTSTRPFTDFILRVHTGESLVLATDNWSWPERKKLGQELLRDLAEDIVRLWKTERDEYVLRPVAEILPKCVNSLELDGYIFSDGSLLIPEEDILDVVEETTLLKGLFSELQLPNSNTVFHHLALSEEHYLEKRWDDSISNSRKFLEGVLQEVATSHYLMSHKTEIPEATYSWPARVREYLESNGLLESKEKEALSSTYVLLSKTGSHPYMAASDQARLLRHLALTWSQFVLLRLKGSREG